MLTLTPAAAEVVRRLVDSSPERASSGLRISASDAEDGGVALELSLVGAPDDLDETIEQQGATIYLDPEAAELLDDKLLDAQITADQVTFVLREDDGPGPEQHVSGRNGHGPDVT